MLTTKNTGLVSGVGLPSSPLTTVRALRGFYDEQKIPRKAGELVEATERFAAFLIAVHKAERYTAPPPPVAVPPAVPVVEQVSSPEVPSASSTVIAPDVEGRRAPREPAGDRRGRGK